MAGRTGNNVVQISGKAYSRERLRRMLQDPKMKVHQKDLPPPPRNHYELKTHPLGPQFEQAERDHLESHQQMESWRKVPRQSLRNLDTRFQVLDSKWVYVYKLDKHGRLNKCKSRLVVRGDQQICTKREETYAATLAGKSFRSVIALAARFDLELIQFDAVNAFCHAILEDDIYIRMPTGYQEDRHLLKL